MVREPPYIIDANVQRYRSLLANPAIPAATRASAAKLLAEALAEMAQAEVSEEKRASETPKG